MRSQGCYGKKCFSMSFVNLIDKKLFVSEQKEIFDRQKTNVGNLLATHNLVGAVLLFFEKKLSKIIFLN